MNSLKDMLTFLTVMSVGAVLALVSAPAALAQNEGRMCISQLGTDLALPIAPTLDGVVEMYPDNTAPDLVRTDNGWNRATKVNLNASTTGTTRTARMLTGWTANDVWIGLVIESPINPHSDDAVVLMLATTPNQAEDWRIIITPFSAASATTDPASSSYNFTNRPPDGVVYWRGSDTWNSGPSMLPSATSAAWLFTPTPVPVPLPPDVSPNIRISRAGNYWSLEMRIPRVATTSPTANEGIFFPSSSPDTFRMYVNVLSTASLSIPTVLQDPWPTWSQARIGPIPQGSSDALENNTPGKDQPPPATGAIWGTASLWFSGTDCTGVSISWPDIGLQDPAGASLALIDLFRTFQPVPLTLAECLGLDDDFPTSDPMTDSHFGQTSDLNVLIAKPTSTLSLSSPANMSVTFKMANFGLPGPPDRPAGFGDWELIKGRTSPPPALIGSNPVAGTLPPTGNPPPYTLNWRLTYKQSCIYSRSYVNTSTGRGHQCMLVEMDSTDTRVRFINRSTTRNMEFVSASTVARDAAISGRGYGPPPAGRANHEFLLWVDTEVQRYDPDRPISRPSTRFASAKVAGAPGGVDERRRPRLGSAEIRAVAPSYFPKGLTEAMVWIARGYRRTGNILRINGRPYEYAENVGGFGYVAGHKGEVQDWRQEFTGPGLTKVGDNLYSIPVPPETSAVVHTTIEAVEPSGVGHKRFSVGLRGGVAIPHDTLNTFFNPHVALTADLEYHATDYFSLYGLLGYRRFSSDFAALSDLNVFQFSGGAKVYVAPGPVRPFFNGGIGAFKFDPGDWHFGAHGGGGLQFVITPKLSLEGEYNFHAVNAPGGDAKFSTLQGGFRFRF